MAGLMEPRGENVTPEVEFEIFRVGVHNGEEYAEEYLDTLVINFDPEFRPVPVFLGHTNWFSDEEKPAGGWIAGLRHLGGRLLAKVKDLRPWFLDAVNAREFPNRSVEIYPNLDGRGPTLAGVAFLGASQPSVPGMGMVTFREGVGRKRVDWVADRGSRIADCRLQNAVGADRKEHLMALADALMAYRAPESDFLISRQDGGEDKMTEQEILERIEKERARAVEEFRQGTEYRELQEAQAEADRLRTEQAEAAVKAHEEDVKRFSARLVKEKRVSPGMATKLEAFGLKHRETWVELKSLIGELWTAKFAALFTERDGGGDRPEDQVESDVSLARRSVSLSLGPKQ